MKKRLKLEVPGGETTILLHTCCAPCSSAIIEICLQQGVRPIIYYSNSNIFPYEEYNIRKQECSRYALMNGLEVVDDDYNHQDWRLITRGLEKEPEKGERCLHCFRFRLHRAARYAHKRGIKVLTTTLASSRWKNLDQVNRAGEFACSIYPDVIWWNQNWRKFGLQDRRNQLIKEMNFYNQNYCGCEFSIESGHGSTSGILDNNSSKNEDKSLIINTESPLVATSDETVISQYLNSYQDNKENTPISILPPLQSPSVEEGVATKNLKPSISAEAILGGENSIKENSIKESSTRGVPLANSSVEENSKIENTTRDTAITHSFVGEQSHISNVGYPQIGLSGEGFGADIAEPILGSSENPLIKNSEDILNK